MPDFLKDVRISIDVQADIRLVLSKTTTSRLVLSLDVSAAGAEFTFIHLSAPTNPNSKNDMPPPIRILKCEMNTLPTIDVPLVSAFEQPFDQMGFVWVSEDLDRQTVDLVNKEIFRNSQRSELVYTDPRKQSSSSPSIVQGHPEQDKVIVAGSHLFVVVQEDNVPTSIVDYIIGMKESNADGGVQVTGNDDLDSASGGASGVLQKSKGPLTVSGLALKYSAPNLRISFDATVDLGGLKGSLKGFGVRFNLANLFSLRIDNVALLIEGVGLQINDPPVTLAGEVMKKGEDYSGGVELGIEPYSFLGGGYYGTASGKDIKGKPISFKTIFVFAELSGPFVELEFASLSDLTAGFGHNSHMTLPTVDNVESFPFLNKSSSAGKPGPYDVINGFLNEVPTAWFSGNAGVLWMAAGMTAKAFHCLDVKAVLTTNMSSTDVVLGLFADATAIVPPEAPPADMFGLFDMDLLAVLDWSKGIFKVEGQLNPKSFILDKDCKLKGGFSLCYFFAGSGHDGDWVLSIGGYHPSFVPPTWYPTPQRVGISWVLDKSITISGDAYFAVTPKACMGGGKLVSTLLCHDILLTQHIFPNG